MVLCGPIVRMVNTHRPMPSMAGGIYGEPKSSMNRYRLHEPRTPIELYYRFKLGDYVTLIEHPEVIGVVTLVRTWKEGEQETHCEQYDVQWRNYAGDGDNKSYGLSLHLVPLP